MKIDLNQPPKAITSFSSIKSLSIFIEMVHQK
jgi:hypothetical protein